MKTRILIIIGIIFSSGIVFANAVPFIPPGYDFEHSKYVLIGKILSVEILSQPVVQKTENMYSEHFGFALYEIKVEKYLKNPISNSTIRVLGEYTNERNTMSYVTKPYEVNQTVLLYLHEENHIPGYDLIIRPSGSKIIDEPLCGQGTEYVDGVCQLIDNGCKPDMYGNIYCDTIVEDRLTLERFLFEPIGNPSECWYQDDDGDMIPCTMGSNGPSMVIGMGLYIFWPYIILGIVVIVIFIVWRKRK